LSKLPSASRTALIRGRSTGSSSGNTAGSKEAVADKAAQLRRPSAARPSPGRTKPKPIGSNVTQNTHQVSRKNYASPSPNITEHDVELGVRCRIVLPNVRIWLIRFLRVGGSKPSGRANFLRNQLLTWVPLSVIDDPRHPQDCNCGTYPTCGLQPDWWIASSPSRSVGTL
jgi:hypothetical protein